jgi:hypothetical protein
MLRGAERRRVAPSTADAVASVQADLASVQEDLASALERIEALEMGSEGGGGGACKRHRPAAFDVSAGGATAAAAAAAPPIPTAAAAASPLTAAGVMDFRTAGVKQLKEFSAQKGIDISQCIMLSEVRANVAAWLQAQSASVAWSADLFKVGMTHLQCAALFALPRGITCAGTQFGEDHASAGCNNSFSFHRDGSRDVPPGDFLADHEVEVSYLRDLLAEQQRATATTGSGITEKQVHLALDALSCIRYRCEQCEKVMRAHHHAACAEFGRLFWGAASGKNADFLRLQR